MAENKKRSTILAFVGYSAFFVGAFLFFCYMTFPYERLRDFLVAKVSEANTGWQLKIGELGPYWLTGVTLDDVELKKPADQPTEPPTEIALDHVTLSVSPIALALGGQEFGFGTEIGAGEIEGQYALEGEEGPTKLAAEFENVDIEKLGLGGYAGLPMKGTLSGGIDLVVAKEPAQTNGEIKLRIDGFQVGDGKAKVPLPGMGSGLTLDTINAGTFELEIGVKEGIAALDKLEGKGPDLELGGSGSLRLVTPLARSRPDITLSVKFSDKYTQKSGRTKAAFDLMKNNPQVKRATAPDGSLRFKVVGSLDKMRLTPAGPARTGPRLPKKGK